MKKLLLFLAGLYCLNGFGQTILASHYLSLKKPLSKQQFLTAVNANNQQIFVFAADKDSQTGYRYNSALFYKDSLSATRPNRDDYSISSGYSFDDTGNPEIYWTSDDYKKILCAHYDFAAKQVVATPYNLDFTNEEITNIFSENNTFYIITSENTKSVLKIYMFKNGQMELKKLDFSSYNFEDDEKPFTFEKIIERHPIEKIDTKALNPLMTGIKKTKLFVYPDKFVLTLDSNSAFTDVFEISLSTFSIIHKSILQPTLKNPAKSNSYYHEGKLYQLCANDTEMALVSTDLSDESLKKLKTFTVTENDSIVFKNSPLYSQTGNQRARELKTTKKFLRRIAESNIGLTVYKTPDDILLTVGGVREVASTGDIILGVTVGVGMVMTGTGAPIDGLLSSESQAVYFEGLFDEKFEHKNLEQQRLASDYVSQFLQENDNVNPQTIFPYDRFFIMGYYDSDSKQYIMRKFSDDGAEN